MNKAKILFFDLETSPNLGYIWQKYETNVIAFKKEWELLTFSWKFLGDKKTKCLTRLDFKDKTDKSLVVALKKVLESADIIVAHNGHDFDFKKANAKFIEHSLGPLPRLQYIDTKRIAKRYFKFNSNSLDDLGNLLGVGRKKQTGGFDLWLRCMAMEKKAFKQMADYNIQDVLLLERVYLKLRPWMEQHPNLTLLSSDSQLPGGCPKCGHDKLHSKGFKYNKTGKYRQYICTNCRGYCLSRTAEKIDKPDFV